MATKAQIAEDIRKQCGSNLVSFGRLSKYLGLSPKTAREFLADVQCFGIANKRCFMVIDVAAKLENCKIPMEPERRVV